jgi:hypothetical protein
MTSKAKKESSVNKACILWILVWTDNYLHRFMSLRIFHRKLMVQSYLKCDIFHKDIMGNDIN